MRFVGKLFEIAGMMFAGALVYEYMRRTVEDDTNAEE